MVKNRIVQKNFTFNYRCETFVERAFVSTMQTVLQIPLNMDSVACVNQGIMEKDVR